MFLQKLEKPKLKNCFYLFYTCLEMNKNNLMRNQIYNAFDTTSFEKKI